MRHFPFDIEPMQPADIPQVLAVEQASYTMSWPRKAYDYELNHNELAHYFVLRLSPVSSEDSSPKASAAIIGLGGFWLMSDEMHITTIAIEAHWRRLGLGEWMLITLLEKGQALRAKVATLEVRPSNQAARALYRKYNFYEVSRRPRYYPDNSEDALIYTTPSLILPGYQAMLRQRQTALYQRLAKINVDKIEQIKLNSAL